MYGNDIADPPDEDSNQPINLYPPRVGEPGDEEIIPPVVVVPLLMLDPPLVL